MNNGMARRLRALQERWLQRLEIEAVVRPSICDGEQGQLELTLVRCIREAEEAIGVSGCAERSMRDELSGHLQECDP